MSRDRTRHPQEVVHRDLRAFRHAQVLTYAAEIPATDYRGAGIEKPYVPVRFRVTQLEVRVEIDVIAAAHLARVVDVEFGRSRGQLNTAQ